MVRPLWGDSQHRLLWLMLLAGPLFVAMENFWARGQFRWIDSIFLWVSALRAEREFEIHYCPANALKVQPNFISAF